MESFKRIDRVSDELKKVVGELIEREVNDPRVGFVTVTGVKVARDFAVAKIYVTVGENDDVEETMAGLKNAAGFLRKRVGERIKLRVTPVIQFSYDKSVDRGFRMDALLKRISEERYEDD